MLGNIGCWGCLLKAVSPRPSSYQVVNYLPSNGITCSVLGPFPLLTIYSFISSVILCRAIVVDYFTCTPYLVIGLGHSQAYFPLILYTRTDDAAE